VTRERASELTRMDLRRFIFMGMLMHRFNFSDSVGVRTDNFTRARYRSPRFPRSAFASLMKLLPASSYNINSCRISGPSYEHNRDIYAEIFECGFIAIIHLFFLSFTSNFRPYMLWSCNHFIKFEL